MTENKISIVKYNNTFDSSVQNFPTYDGYLQIEHGYLVITLKKPCAKPEYIMNSDPS